MYRKMRQDVEAKNRTWQGVTYKKCFLAQDAIAWMAKKDFLPLENISYGDLRRKLRRRTEEIDSNVLNAVSNGNGSTSNGSPSLSPHNNANSIPEEKKRLAVEFADKLRRFGYFTHVVDESKPFSDAFLFFRFTKLTKGTSSSSFLSSQRLRRKQTN